MAVSTISDNSTDTVQKDSVEEKKQMGMGKFIGLIGLGVVLLLSLLSVMSISANNTQEKDNEIIASYGFEDIEEAVDFNGNHYTSAINNNIYYKVKVSNDEEAGGKSISAVVDVEKMNGGAETVPVEKDYSEYGDNLTDFQKELVDKGWGWLM